MDLPTTKFFVIFAAGLHFINKESLFFQTTTFPQNVSCCGNFVNPRTHKKPILHPPTSFLRAAKNIVIMRHSLWKLLMGLTLAFQAKSHNKTCCLCKPSAAVVVFQKFCVNSKLTRNVARWYQTMNPNLQWLIIVFWFGLELFVVICIQLVWRRGDVLMKLFNQKREDYRLFEACVYVNYFMFMSFCFKKYLKCICFFSYYEDMSRNRPQLFWTTSCHQQVRNYW